MESAVAEVRRCGSAPISRDFEIVVWDMGTRDYWTVTC